MESAPLLIWASPEKDSDILYFSQFSAPDEILAIRAGSKKIGIINSLEYGRAQNQSGFDEIISWEQIADQASAKGIAKPVPVLHIILQLLENYHWKKILVPENFPTKLSFQLMENGIEVSVAPSPLFPERLSKSDQELEYIRYGNQCSAAGIKEAEKILQESKIQNNLLYWNSEPLSSEILHFQIAVSCLKMGAIANNTIAAGGDQACDPHHHGSGPLKANELIIVDVFPRVTETGYHGDMTRTFLKGKASSEQKALVATVREAQQKAIAIAKAGIRGDEIHALVNNTFLEKGYKTSKTEKGYQGFFHGTGHGLGLDIHEAPRVSLNAGPLENGHVVTIEPGLYYPGLGGVRIEDVIAITKDGCQLLSDFHYNWQID